MKSTITLKKHIENIALIAFCGLLITNSTFCNSQNLTTITGKRIYEHHSSSINANLAFGNSANGYQSAYDFVNHVYKNSTTATDITNIDLVEDGGPFGNGTGVIGFTSGISEIWGGSIKGNSSTKYYLTPTTFNYSTATTVNDLKNAYLSGSSALSVTSVLANRTYVAKIRNTDLYVAIKVTSVKSLTNTQVQSIQSGGDVFADVYFDFEYKYGTLISTGTEAISEEFNFQIFPNPVINNIKLIGFENAKNVKIFNSVGNLIMDYNTLTNDIINLSELSPGSYFISATVNEKPYSQKFIKME